MTDTDYRYITTNYCHVHVYCTLLLYMYSIFVPAFIFDYVKIKLENSKYIRSGLSLYHINFLQATADGYTF